MLLLLTPSRALSSTSALMLFVVSQLNCFTLIQSRPSSVVTEAFVDSKVSPSSSPSSSFEDEGFFGMNYQPEGETHIRRVVHDSVDSGVSSAAGSDTSLLFDGNHDILRREDHVTHQVSGAASSSPKRREDNKLLRRNLLDSHNDHDFLTSSGASTLDETSSSFLANPLLSPESTVEAFDDSTGEDIKSQLNAFSQQNYQHQLQYPLQYHPLDTFIHSSPSSQQRQPQHHPYQTSHQRQPDHHHHETPHTVHTEREILPSSSTSDLNLHPLASHSLTSSSTGSGSGSEMIAQSTHHHQQHGQDHSGWLDMGAYSGKHGAFGWYADFPVGGHSSHGYGK